MDSMRSKAQKMMPHIMALNKNPTMGMKNNRQPKPGVSNLTAYAQGGKVKNYDSPSFFDNPKKYGELAPKSSGLNKIKKYASSGIDTDAYMSGKTAGVNRQSQAKNDSALNAYANRGKDYIKDKLDDVDVAISKKIGLTERAKNKESFRMGLKEEGYAKGGKAMARHNKLMHPGQKSKLMSGGMVKGYQDGGRAAAFLASKGFSSKGTGPFQQLSDMVKKDDTEKGLKKAFNQLEGERGTRETKTKLKETFDQLGDERTKRAEVQAAKKPLSFGEKFNAERKKQGAGGTFEWNGKKYSTNQADDAPRSDDFFAKRAQQRNKETAPSDDYKPSGYKKGGKVKGDKKKVMGTVGEAKALMNAMKKVRRPATPMPGARMAGLGMAPPMAPQMMAPPMKRGGKVMKKAAGGSKKRHTNSKGV
tara:strand:+ start:1771 stop:3024 length:1254 start_codon:yes stop_codon:yes gene_type:complete